MSQRIHCDRALLVDGWHRSVTFKVDASGMIESILRDDPGVESNPRCEEVVLSGAVIPGMPNLHSHGFQRMLAGLGGKRQGTDSFWTWRAAMYELALKLTPEQLGACQAGLYVEMLKAGYTSCAEFHYLHKDPDGMPYADPAELSVRVSRSASAAGIGLTLLPVLYRRSGFTAETVETHQRRFHSSMDEYALLLERCRELAGQAPGQRVGIAPHSLRAVGAKELQDLLTLAETSDPVHIHVAEQPAEVESCLASNGARPVEWLLDQADVDANWCLVHATHMTGSERQNAVQSGAVAGLCPSTEADLGDGVFAARAWMQEQGAWGIGSDSNIRVDVAEELRWLEYGQRLRHGQRLVLVEDHQHIGEHLYRQAAVGGAQALGQPVGQLAVGFRADFLELDREAPLLAGLPDEGLLDSYLFANTPGMIKSVWVRGQLRVRGNRHVSEDTVSRDFNRALREVRA